MLAVDTEFVGEKYYYAKLELIQVGDGSRIFLIDAPACRDLSPLSRLFADPDCVKIFHAADQDLELLARELGKPVEPMFDTQIAGSLLGYGAQISLTNLVREIAGASMSGKHSTSDWTHRPLSAAQLEYAADDVRYLPAVYKAMCEKLEAKSRRSWYDDEQTVRLERIYAEKVDEREVYRRVKDWMSLPPRDLAVLRELADWREQTARVENIPRRRVCTDDGLIELARFHPETRDKVKKLRRVNVGQVLRHFDAIYGAIKVGLALPKDQWPEKPRGERVDIAPGVLELCQALLRTVADDAGVAPTVLARTSDLQRLLARDFDDNPVMQGWRFDVVGSRLKALLEGLIHVRIDSNGELAFEENR